MVGVRDHHGDTMTVEEYKESAFAKRLRREFAFQRADAWLGLVVKVATIAACATYVTTVVIAWSR